MIKRTLANFLKEYLKITNRKKEELADEINIQSTKITLLLEGKDKLDKALSFRLERHSGDIIPALYWWKKKLNKKFLQK